ncbi:DUF5682 family protein [Flavobacterium sp. MXW15]|uniref:DUF5682 family protein n=1 Tax=Xanthomonas chitinilytica TaxID=2989819 RepID=A0ABT3JSF2_9XANT|nr:DUF5682 family protein [Xanthomonas sp. H13-6]MCW4454177.1 DUF5682 family protein [Flavobacterium sp. MXW15]MCW4471411.1 DUF5682 family protein [Xanthomonas sp. H13-6]
MSATVHYFGIRHHGPGSARRLLQALEALQPAMLLVEGPADAGALLPALADPAMVPPVALLNHAADDPELAVFHPFAEFSPEYQAIVWALRRQLPVRFIDLPAGLELAARKAARDAQAAEADDADQAPEDAQADAEGDDEREEHAPAFAHDPIGELARLAGYDDGESWWHDWVESGHDAPAETFAAVADMMQALRESAAEPGLRERRREAHMRLSIAQAAREAGDGAVAVVCGAWHVPALRAKTKQADDKALLRGLPKTAVRSTWVPWTLPRLSTASGYGAGVDAPRWYAHLWRHGGDEAALSHWLVQVAHVFRAGGAPASPASVIETVRLAGALARLRARPAPGYEEMRDAVIACLCGGEPLVWQQHERELLLGGDVGSIPPDTPLMPLLEDLQRQQKATRLKPEALERELALDLRSDAGNARSQLLHRLRLLDVPWGVQGDAGGSRGTFRERWTLRWEPEFAVALVENLVHGTTIEQAAGNRAIARMQGEGRMSALTALVNTCLEAQLPRAVEAGIRRLAEVAAQAQECVEMLATLPPLVSLRRYGSARRIELGQVAGLVERLLVQATLALPYASRNLDAEQAAALCEAIAGWAASLSIAELDEAAAQAWWQALDALVEAAPTHRRVAGLAARLLLEAERRDVAQTQALMLRMFSPGEDSADAAQFFEGFFLGAAAQLLHQRELLAGVDAWLAALPAETFQQQLPLLRRVLSALDGNERRHLLERVLSPQAGPADTLALDLRHLDAWNAHAARLGALLTGDPPAWPT